MKPGLSGSPSRICGRSRVRACPPQATARALLPGRGFPDRLCIGPVAGYASAVWAVLTAIILTQISVGRSLKATIDYLAGTIGGAIYGGVVSVLVGP
jgi:hypothetical protein